MKLAEGLIVVILLTTAAVSQSATQPTGQSGQSQAQTTQRSSGRRPVQAKNMEEYNAYQAAMTKARDPEAMEKAADEFAAKFPDSDVRILLYRTAMSGWQNLGNSQKMMDVGLKVLNLDKDDPDALIGVAEGLEEHTSPTDLDKDERAKRAIGYAQHALETIDIDLAVPTGTAPERVEAYKKNLRATALAIMGTVHYKQEEYEDAEVNLRKAIEADPGNPDPVVILRLALALDQQEKYKEALEQANRAVELTKENTEVGRSARSERDRLVIETRDENSLPPPQAPQSSAAPPSSH